MENEYNTYKNLGSRIRRLELQLRISLAISVLAVSCAFLWFVSRPSQAQQSAAPSTMRVAELVVVDKKGVARIRIGGDLPDAIIGGKPVPRGQQAAGVLLYDAAGNERSGYITFEPSGNVGLTLDSRTSQVASFVASAEGNASAFSLWTGKDMIELRSDGEGARLTALKDGQVAVQQPIISSMSREMCAAYKNALARVSATQVMSDCRRRFTETPCKTCLEEK